MGCNCNEKKGNFSAKASVISTSRIVTSAVKSFVLENYDPMVSEEIREQRLKICENCENYTLTLNKPRCSICGCFLRAKTSLRDQACPHPEGPKWSEE